jgi:hypothetical protein
MHACMTAMLLGVLVAVGFAIKLLLSPDWKFVPGVTTGLLLAASTFVYYIKWSDQWFKEHARAEIRNRRLEADIQRAAWLSEMFFETKDKQLPESFFEHFARGLFSEEQMQDTEHPADQLAKLVRSVSGVKVGKEGVDIALKGSDK